MGRHSSPEQAPFLRSVATWFLPWALIAIVAGTAVWIAVDALGKGDLDGERPAATTSESPSEEPTATLAEETPTPEVTIATPTPTPSPKITDVELITAGVTVQILNASTSAEADEVMADRLARLGYEIAVIDSASKTYEQTTVFWSSEEWREAAERLAERFGWVAEVKPDNLSATVSIHVVVGQDEI